VVKQYKELTTKILSITFLILAFLTIHLGDHGAVNVLISLIVISQLLIKLLHLCLDSTLVKRALTSDFAAVLASL
jgi:hypothetical protein